MRNSLTFDQILNRLHLHAVLPVLETLVKFSSEAREVAAKQDFILRLAVFQGPEATLVCRDGMLTAHCGTSQPPAEITLRFLTAKSLNRLFANQRALPPLPLGWPWRWSKLRHFLALTKLLDRHLQPSPALLAANPEFRRLHLRLLLSVLASAAPIVSRHDAVAQAALAETLPGVLELQAPMFDFNVSLSSAESSTPHPKPDATIRFRDDETLEAALNNKLDAQAAIGLGRLEVRGLIPLADAWSVVLDRVEDYLQPKSAAVL